MSAPPGATPPPGTAALTATEMNAGYRSRPVLHDVSLSFGPGLHLALWAPAISAGELLGVAGGTTPAIAVAGVATVARRFRPDAVLES